MKRLICIIAAIMMLFAQTVYAEEQTAQSTILYTQNDSFSIYIPETITVNQPVAVQAAEINIRPDRAVYVDIVNDGDYVNIYNAEDPSHALQVYFQRIADGTRITGANPTIGSFSAQDQSSTLDFFAAIEDTSGAKAGDYTGMVTFKIRCE